MNLDETQNQKIADHIKGITAYAETYNELYDHVLSALSSEKQHPFNMDIVAKILDDDFGGTSTIKLEEENYQKKLGQNFSNLLWKEMINTFKFPAITGNITLLALYYLLYTGGAAEQSRIKLLGSALIISMFIPLLMYIVKVYIIDRNHIKPSIKNPALKSSSLFGINVAIFVTFVFLAKGSIFDPSLATKLLILLGTSLLLSIYIRAYLKIYNNTVKLKPQ
jgi:hypothetical protein